MDFLFRFLSLIAVIIFGTGASTQRHFSIIRVACIAVDVLVPLLTSGEEVQMANPDPKPPASGAGEHHETQQQTPPHPAEQQSNQQPPEEPSATNSAAQVRDEEDANRAALEDLRQHGTQMTKAERKQAEDYLRAKYGATDPQEPADTADEAR
ncbi:uncharacterized protein EMH_0078320 [Eimeria mitis]|uniref:Uncharacterized protein n=1 Tax=Eimeria mitis TaxID=44415 RepID=U6K497_9EIME|nr:uncharacterized protein EMH_0064560 [Eimeria mitis]XP_013355435.1 uncharacterized protein EMH_0078320 [Eimeria mitis]CDJ31157.1 hypothetical protein EMH_0064560 [Eimeria mitis]CDJ32871.1 hypothetical protein, conserved [Eimeria mitis]